MSRSIEKPHKVDQSEIYSRSLQQIEGVLAGEPDLIANMANVAAIVKEALGFHWVGFYLVRENELVLGPFQGPIACTRIARAKGVCGTAWNEARTLLVEDVNAFPGHIACSALSRSELVIPLMDDLGKVIGVFDIDSSELGGLNELDKENLEMVVELLMRTQKNA